MAESAIAIEQPRPSNRQRRFWESAFFRHRPAGIALILLIVLFVLAVAAPLIVPYPPNETNLRLSLDSPSSQHWLGTDKQGRDILSRLIFGTRTAMTGALLVVLVSGLGGITLGLIGGYYGGWLDSTIMRFWDMLLAFPPLLLAFVIVATFGRGYQTAIIGLAIVYMPMISRVVRSVALVQKQEQYVEAARSIGCSNLRILGWHILPNCMTAILVQSTLDMGYAILDLAALSFLGLAVQPPTADWGSMLSNGMSHLLVSPNLALAAGFAIMISVISFNLMGDGLAVYLDPRQRTTQHA